MLNIDDPILLTERFGWAGVSGVCWALSILSVYVRYEGDYKRCS